MNVPTNPCPKCHGRRTQRFLHWFTRRCTYCAGTGTVTMYRSVDWHRAEILKSLKQLENAKLPDWIKK